MKILSSPKMVNSPNANSAFQVDQSDCLKAKKIGRAKNMEKLEKEIKELTHKLDDIRGSLLEKQTDLEKLRNNSLRQQMEEVQNAIRQVNEEFVSIRTKREQFAEMLSNADLRREDILEKIDTLLKELDDLKPKAKQAYTTSKNKKINSGHYRRPGRKQ